MNQENIFKLLLIILLINNNHGGECGCNSTAFGSSNDVIILALLLGLLDSNSTATASTDLTTDTTF